MVVFKIVGTLALIIPKVPGRIKEWAYAGFAFTFIFASISHWAVDGFGMQALFPLLFLVILIVSWAAYDKLSKNKFDHI